MRSPSGALKTTSAPEVAIVGAGIGGLTLAAALARRGIRCEVYEQAQRLAEVGAGVQLAPNAVRLLHRIGLEGRLRACAVRPEALEMRRWDDDRLIARTQLGEACEALFGAPYYTVHRADLQKALVGLLADDVIHLGHRLIQVEEQSDHVVLRFADGSSRTADLVVGADGIHSVVREALIEDRPVFSRHSIYRGLVPGERLPDLVRQPRVRIWLGPMRHCVCYAVSSGRTISFAATTPAEDWSMESWSAAGEPAELADAYSGWNDIVAKLIRAAGTVQRWALHDREPLPRWSSERATVLGDAAHPMLPFMAQGANQAVEDAMALAAGLSGSSSDQVSRALLHYEAVRAPRAALVQTRSRANTSALHLPDGPMQIERDAQMAAGLDLPRQAWLYGYDAESAVDQGTRQPTA
jgi:salicylate hydroxylase